MRPVPCYYPVCANMPQEDYYTVNLSNREINLLTLSERAKGAHPTDTLGDVAVLGLVRPNGTFVEGYLFTHQHDALSATSAIFDRRRHDKMPVILIKAIKATGQTYLSCDADHRGYRLLLAIYRDAHPHKRLAVPPKPRWRRWLNAVASWFKPAPYP